jgi:hypothetical protein
VRWAMYADLHNIATAQEAYFHDHGSYGTDVSFNGGRPRNGSNAHVVAASATTWEAVATHPQSPLTCSIAGKRGETWTRPVCK